MGDGGGGRCTVIKLFMIVVSWQNFGSTQCLHQLGVKQQSKTLSFGPSTDQLDQLFICFFQHNSKNITFTLHIELESVNSFSRCIIEMKKYKVAFLLLVDYDWIKVSFEIE